MSSTMNQQSEEAICCPKFDPAPWDEKRITWDNKLFIKEQLKSFLHIPIGIKAMMIRNMELIKKENALPEAKDFVFIADEKSLWGADYFIHVTKEIAGAENVKISGTFLTKVFEGPFSKIRCWTKEMMAYVAAKNEKLEKIYFYYTTCPKCAKKYGKNYVVLLAKIKESE